MSRKSVVEEIAYIRARQLEISKPSEPNLPKTAVAQALTEGEERRLRQWMRETLHGISHA
jgi:hypothetical protein